MGFTDVLIADYDSNDGTSTLLRHLARKGLIRLAPFPTRLHRAPQLDAYRHFITLAQKLKIACFDADGFLLTARACDDFADHLARQPADIGAVALNWATYGSSGHSRAGKEPVPYRFTYRAPVEGDVTAEMNVNLHYKTVLRPEAFDGYIPNPHHMSLRDGYRHVLADGSRLTLTAEGIADRILWEPFRINHYTTRSWGEFIQKKLSRGLADIPSLTRSTEFFYRHDLNQEADPVPDWLRAGFDAKRAALLRAAGPCPALDRAIEEMLGFAPPAPSGAAELADNIANPAYQGRAGRRRMKLRRKSLALRRLFARRTAPALW